MPIGIELEMNDVGTFANSFERNVEVSFKNEIFEQILYAGYKILKKLMLI